MKMPCDACGMHVDYNASKCEHCKSKITEGIDYYNTVIEEWEDDFRFIEEAEIKGEVYELVGSEYDACSLESFEGQSGQITQYIKEEPEIQIEPDVIGEEKHNAGKAEVLQERVKKERSHHLLTSTSRRKSSLAEDKRVKRRKSATGQRRLRAKPRTKGNIIVYQCEICNKVTKGFEEHKKHKKSHEPQTQIKSIPNSLINCNQCDDNFLHEYDLKSHQKLHEAKKDYRCDVCNVFLSNENVLNKHKARIHVAENKSKAEKFICSFCGEKFPLQILMTNHKNTHIENVKMFKETAMTHQVNGQLTYLCTICGKNSANKSRHTDHLKVHTKERPFKCDLCDSRFTARSSLRQHLRLHSDERPFKCHICDVTYRHKKSLKNHLRHHIGARPYKCQYCDKTFALKFIKVDHERQVHTGETLYQCNVCQEWFTTSAFLNAHRRSQHNIDTNSKRRVEILINKVNLSENESSSGVKRKTV